MTGGRGEEDFLKELEVYDRKLGKLYINHKSEFAQSNRAQLISLNIRSGNANLQKLLEHVTGLLEQPIIIALQEIWSIDKAERLVNP